MELSQSVTYSYASTTENLRSKEDDEEALKWDVLERLPTRNRVRKGILHGVTGELKEIDIRGLSVKERKKLVDRLVRNADNNEEFLLKLKTRIDRVGIELPTIEVRFKNLKVEAETKPYVGRRALPSVLNFFVNLVKDAAGVLHVISSRKTIIPILHDVSGIIRPGRLTLLLGLPGSGKTTLLRALSGKLPSQLKKSSGYVTYNGHAMREFVPERTSAYISEYDVHMPLLTVRETLTFSAKCQGVGSNYDMLMELLRREKLQNIKPDPYIDALMKASVLKGQEDIVTDYILKILGIEGCADTIIGNDMIRGISGGQKRRVTTGEVLVGPANALFMDNISTGLDSSTTFQIVSSIRQSNHIFSKTMLISLLQPPPETYELFDDIILLSEGQIVYQGPRVYVLEFFEWMGFKCPERKGVADFLQEVTSRKDQRQYWDKEERHYRYVSASEFAGAFTSFHVGRAVEQELHRPFEKSKNHPAALTKQKYGASKKDLLKACFSREAKLMMRSLSFQIIGLLQVMFCAIVLATLYVHYRNKRDTLNDGIMHIGSLFFLIYIITFTGFFALPTTIDKLPVFYKQRDLHFYPSWAFSLPLFIINIPTSIVHVIAMMAITYYALGFNPSPNRIAMQFLVLVMHAQTFYSLFRCMATITRDHTTGNTVGNFTLLWLFIFGGFLVSRETMKKWLRWAFYTSPLMYAQTSIFTNEFLGSTWAHALEGTNQTAGIAILQSRGFSTNPSWQWIGICALIGFIVLYNVIATLALAYLNQHGKSCATNSESETVMSDEMEEHGGSQSLQGKLPTAKVRPDIAHSRIDFSDVAALLKTDGLQRGRQKLLSFFPLSVTFENIMYSVDIPKGVNNQTDNRLVLLKGISGCFRPGVLTAMMGVSGAGKTTLMDVLAGRKNTGYIEGNIIVSGRPKNQASFSRVSGYCEQTDVHTPFLTVYESLVYSAWLRLPRDVDSRTRELFIEEVMDLIELAPIRDDLVGVAAVNGLTVEQRKRLTIAVELVANPSVVFMDEPTSGLDARAAAVVMRTIRKTVDTGRAIVCTIHQPSVEIFESFDELFLLNQGGVEIYVGPLGQRSREMVKYFENIPGVGKIGKDDNPATWVMEITSRAREEILGVNFGQIYKASKLYQKNMELIQELNTSSHGEPDFHSTSKYSQPFFTQLRACLWKQSKCYWRNVPYNGTRYIVTILVAVMFGILFWNLGSKRKSKEEVFSGVGAMFSAIMSMGPYCVTSVLPVVIYERTVYYRERAAGMYSVFPHAIAQFVIEIPYTFVQALIYCVIIYATIGYEWTAPKFLLNLFFMFIYIFSYINFGIMIISITPSQALASLVAGTSYTMWSLFSGFVIPSQSIVKGWRWYTWLCPSYWSLYGLATAQYGDGDRKMVSGEGVKEYLSDYFGFRHEMLWEVSVVMICFTLFFFIVYAVSMKVLNFQKR